MSVYFIRVGRYFKIGASDNAQRRLERLAQSGTRYTFPADASIKLSDRHLYKVVDGWVSEEARIHLALDDFAVGLEWFLDEPPLREFVDSMPATVPLDIAKVERPGGFCAGEYARIQQGRADREMSRYEARRSA